MSNERTFPPLSISPFAHIDSSNLDAELKQPHAVAPINKCMPSPVLPEATLTLALKGMAETNRASPQQGRRQSSNRAVHIFPPHHPRHIYVSATILIGLSLSILPRVRIWRDPLPRYTDPTFCGSLGPGGCARLLLELFRGLRAVVAEDDGGQVKSDTACLRAVPRSSTVASIV